MSDLTYEGTGTEFEDAWLPCDKCKGIGYIDFGAQTCDACDARGGNFADPDSNPPWPEEAATSKPLEAKLDHHGWQQVTAGEIWRNQITGKEVRVVSRTGKYSPSGGGVYYCGTGRGSRSSYLHISRFVSLYLRIAAAANEALCR